MKKATYIVERPWLITLARQIIYPMSTVAKTPASASER
jgi:hypothetical protein